MPARRLCFLALCLILALGLSSRPAAAQTVARLGVIFVNTQGLWDRTTQEQWESAATITVPNVEIVGFAKLLAEPAGATLSPAQRELLLRCPEMLLASERAARLLNVRYALIVRIDKTNEGRLHPTVHDLNDGSQLSLTRIRASGKAAALAALSKRLSEALARLGAPVWGHVAAKVYHVTSCDHVRPDQIIVIDSEQEALRNGYEACAVCFDTDTRIRAKANQEHTLGNEVGMYIERRYHLDGDAERQARVARVGSRLVTANGLGDFTYTFRVLDADEPNAFAAGAGRIYITRGLEKLTAGNDDMLASVLGHEMGHTEEHHVLRQYQQAQTWAVLGTIASVATGVYWPGLLADFVGGLIGRGNGRVYELESDRLGVIYTYAAGYRPDDFILVMNALKQVSGKRSAPGWLRTHPTEEKRLERTRALVGQLQTLDETVRAYEAIEPALGIWIRRNARATIDRVGVLAEALPVWTAVARAMPIETRAADAADDEGTPDPIAPAPQRPATEAPSEAAAPTPSQGIGAPSSSRPTVESDGTQVRPGPPGAPPQFIHD